MYNTIMYTKADIIVIGAGPAGIAAAVKAKREGLNVVVVERGKLYGSKNMFGGAVYLQSIKDLFPDDWQSCPIERKTVSHGFEFLTNNEEDVSFTYSNKNSEESATVFRPKFDEWLVETAKKEGVYFAPSTTVRDFIIEDNKVTGIKTDIEELRAPLTIIAEGVNTLLTEKLDLKPKSNPKDIILGVKEVIKLDQKIINERFNLEDNEGKISEFFGGLDEDIMGLGILYTFKDHIAIGLGLSLADLPVIKKEPYVLLDKFKSHPQIQKLIKDGLSVEYSAHLIPDGGYKKLSKLYKDGVLVVGDAAGFINPVHFEGTNLAIYSGLIAGEVAAIAHKKQDYTSKTLKLYKDKIYKSFIIEDLKSYKNVMSMVYGRKKSIFKFYPELMADFFSKFTSSKPIPKKKLYRAFVKKVFFSRNITEMFADCFEFAKVLIEVIK